jgi:hypothetical protein
MKSLQTIFATDTPLVERYLLQGQPTVNTGMSVRFPVGTRRPIDSKKEQNIKRKYTLINKTA